MTRDQAPDGPPPDPPAASQDLMRDWATIWASELAALAVDPEWPAWVVALWPDGEGEPSGGAGAVPPARAPAAAAPPDDRPDQAGGGEDPRLLELRRLRERVAELERELGGTARR